MTSNNWITYTSDSTAGPIWISDFARRPGILPQPIWREVDTLFDRFVKNLPEPCVVEDAKYPKTNAWESDAGLHMDLAVPYLTKEDLSIDVDTRLRKVTVEGSGSNDETEGIEFLKREISRTSFKRTFLVGQEFDLSKMTAELEGGILKILVPHSADEKTRYKKISID